MKKSLLSGLILGVALLTVGCGNGSSETKASSSESAVSESTKKEADNGTLGKYKVSILGFSKAEDYEGTPVGVVQYEFTNNSDTNQMFSVAIGSKAFQNGVALDTAVMTEDGYTDSLTEIQPGATITVKVAYKLADQEAPVTVEVSENFSLGDDKLTKEFPLN
ncbi:DUF5067 domain-containing protein [Carnobacterium gallinarum]|uniref:DUF5067 domain-containing protein n=1 Tax=Carnobacterium gallinarum TaxID=2749 RepID=UPI000557706A|nr:DUF5067 domain-containing protein [Carnobacterium gallinarum]